MYQEFFLQKGVLVLPIVAMLSFGLAFIAILWWSLRMERKLHNQELAQLPLDGDREVRVAERPKGVRP